MVKSIFLVLSLIVCGGLAEHVYASEKLIFAIDIIRHGDRTPLLELPKAPHHWQEGLGQLTPIGMAQEYQLGKRLREEYIIHNQLLPEQYSNKTMYVRSTEFDRTVMSAQSVLLGLYPLGKGPKNRASQAYALPHGYQPIPIFTIPQEEDSLLRPFNDKFMFRKLLQKYLFSTPEWIEKEPKLKQNMAKWGAATGLTLTNPVQLQELADTIFIYQLYQLPLPPDLSPDDIKAIKTSVHNQWSSLYKNPAIASIAGSKQLTAIVEKLQTASQKKSELKYILYSAHDSTLVAQMAVLETPLTEWPAYASRLNFSLYEEGNSHDIVRITYNNQPVLIPACNGLSCHLADLVSLADEKAQFAAVNLMDETR